MLLRIKECKLKIKDGIKASPLKYHYFILYWKVMLFYCTTKAIQIRKYHALKLDYEYIHKIVLSGWKKDDFG